MLDLFWMLSTPDAQPGDWYGWLTAYAGHALFVGAPIAALLLALGWHQWLGALAYWAWEMTQVFVFNGQFSDSLVDWSAVVLGQALVWAAWRGHRKVFAGAGALIAIVAAIGAWKRGQK